jgi:hypothetical protein
LLEIENEIELKQEKKEGIEIENENGEKWKWILHNSILLDELNSYVIITHNPDLFYERNGTHI